MPDLTAKVQAALAAYLRWGQLAAESLVRQDDEAFDAAMTQREQIFAHLRALDAQASGHLPRTAELHDLWLQIDIINKTLAGHMALLQAELKSQLDQPPHLRVVESA